MKPVAEAAGTGFATGKKESETISASSVQSRSDIRFVRLKRRPRIFLHAGGQRMADL